jgi:hypothetical protein
MTTVDKFKCLGHFLPANEDDDVDICHLNYLLESFSSTIVV